MTINIRAVHTGQRRRQTGGSGEPEDPGQEEDDKVAGNASKDTTAGGSAEEEGHEDQVEYDGPDGGEERERVAVAERDARIVVVRIIPGLQPGRDRERDDGSKRQEAEESYPKSQCTRPFANVRSTHQGGSGGRGCRGPLRLS